MFSVQPVGNLLGLIVACLGATMLVPAGYAMVFEGGEAADVFLLAAALSCVTGLMLAIGTAGFSRSGLNIQQVFLMTTLVWLVLPVFGALPFFLGERGLSYTDSFFEAMSGLTTTGATIYTDLENRPKAILLWRGMLQWFGGIGIIVVAMALLPALRVGGMQIFRTEAFDTMGKVLPRAAEISVGISTIYLTLTVACMVAYAMAGVPVFDAVVHAFTTVATGGFSTYDTSFSEELKGGPEYVGVVFMILASLPFVRYVQLTSGTARPLLLDPQVRGFVLTLLALAIALTVYQMLRNGDLAEPAFRESLFNTTSILSGTGYASANYQSWGPFPMAVFFLMGLIGGCAGSTCCSIKIFRFQLLLAAIRAQIRRLRSPHGVFAVRYDGRPVEEDVMSSVMAFFMMFMLSLLVVSVAISLTGEDTVTSISGAASALANIGPGLGEKIGPTGTFAPLNDQAKWILALAMLIGRLELMSVFVLFTIGFWRR